MSGSGRGPTRRRARVVCLTREKESGFLPGSSRSPWPSHPSTDRRRCTTVVRRLVATAAISGSLLLGLAATANASSPTTLNFDEFTTSSFIPSNQYASSGVLFDRLGGGQTFVFSAASSPSVLVDPNGSAFSVPAMLCGNNPANVGLVATFVDPVTFGPATTTFVQVNVSSGPGPDLLSSNVALIAYDMDGNVIATDPGDTTLQFDTLSVSIPGIARVEMTAAGDLDCYDDFTFNTPSSSPPDSDNDGIVDSADNCPDAANPGQADLDGDGLGDVCDPDRDGDGVANGADNCIDVANAGQVDTDGDGVGDACDPLTYQFSGFFSPVDNLPTINAVKAGSAVPVKFSLGGNQGLGVIAVGFPKAQQVPCDSTAPVDGIEETVTPGASALSYNAITDRYQYVWKTDKAWAGTCRQFVLKLADGGVHRAVFSLR